MYADCSYADCRLQIAAKQIADCSYADCRLQIGDWSYAKEEVGCATALKDDWLQPVRVGQALLPVRQRKQIRVGAVLANQINTSRQKIFWLFGEEE